MITLLKLGGSLITDKTKRQTFRQDVMQRLANEIQHALDAKPDMQLIIGHGSGSFGHFEAKQFGTMQGVQTPEQWRGFASVATVAAELSYLVAQQLSQASVPVMRFQPSASAHADDGVIVDMAIEPIDRAFKNGIVPLVHGDVAFDAVRGGTIISTETVFAYLVQNLPVSKLILVGEVDGVLDNQEQVISRITPQNIADVESALRGSEGIDVTGGMVTKVHDSLHLATNPPYPTVQIINGKIPHLVRQALLGEPVVGTTIAKD